MRFLRPGSFSDFRRRDVPSVLRLPALLSVLAAVVCIVPADTASSGAR